jgi:hypothetical protein
MLSLPRTMFYLRISKMFFPLQKLSSRTFTVKTLMGLRNAKAPPKGKKGWQIMTPSNYF